MSTPKMHPIQGILSDAGYSVRAYSGRGMDGKTCLGVTECSLSQLLRIVFDIGVDLGFESYDDEDEKAGATKQIKEVRAGLRVEQDSLGRGQIFYFPTVPFFGEDGS